MIIYKTTNLVNGKVYIGQNSSNDPKYIGSGLLLTHAIKKYGYESFKKEILEKCNSKDELNDRERYWIKHYSSTTRTIGYNISEGGTGGKLVAVEGKKGKTYEEYYGLEKATQLKLQMSVSRRGKKLGYKNITPEEVGKKISEALKGRKLSEDHKRNVSDGVKEFFKTVEGEELRRLISEKNRGRVQSDETRLKQSLALKGKRPKMMDVHPSAQFWSFYDKDNNLIAETLGNRTKVLKELGSNQRRIVIFSDLQNCLNFDLPLNKDYKLFTKKYYNKNEN